MRMYAEVWKHHSTFFLSLLFSLLSFLSFVQQLAEYLIVICHFGMGLPSSQDGVRCLFGLYGISGRLRKVWDERASPLFMPGTGPPKNEIVGSYDKCVSNCAGHFLSLVTEAAPFRGPPFSWMQSLLYTFPRERDTLRKSQLLCLSRVFSPRWTGRTLHWRQANRNKGNFFAGFDTCSTTGQQVTHRTPAKNVPREKTLKDNSLTQVPSRRKAGVQTLPWATPGSEAFGRKWFLRGDFPDSLLA